MMKQRFISIEDALEDQNNTLSSEDIKNLWNTENTATGFNKMFSINSKSVATFILNNGIEKIRTEVIKTGRGFRNIYLASDIFAKAKKLGLNICIPLDQIQIKEKALGIAEIQLEIDRKKSELESINKAIEHAKSTLSHEIDTDLLDGDEVLLLAGKVKPKCGIYFLIKGFTIVYIGQSTNILNRISTHKSTKDFDSFTYIACEKENLNMLEARYIKKFKPIGNHNSLGVLVLPVSASEFRQK